METKQIMFTDDELMFTHVSLSVFTVRMWTFCTFLFILSEVHVEEKIFHIWIHKESFQPLLSPLNIPAKEKEKKNRRKRKVKKNCRCDVYTALHWFLSKFHVCSSEFWKSVNFTSFGFHLFLWVKLVLEPIPSAVEDILVQVLVSGSETLIFINTIIIITTWRTVSDLVPTSVLLNLIWCPLTFVFRPCLLSWYPLRLRPLDWPWS